MNRFGLIAGLAVAAGLSPSTALIRDHGRLNMFTATSMRNTPAAWKVKHALVLEGRRRNAPSSSDR
jgi:hypothetical protein